MRLWCIKGDNMSLKLIYFKMRALAEAPQMLMHCYDIDYQYLMSWEHFDDVWANVKPTITFQQLPMLEVDGEAQICQSVAILQYLENRAGIAISDLVKAAQASAILQSAQELFAPLNPAINFAIGDDFMAKKEAMLPGLSGRFSDLARCLESGREKFFTDDTARAAEFATYHHLDLSKLLDPSLVQEFPRLMAFISDMESLPGMASYLSKRPKLIDVGTAPKLVIEDVAHPTGMKKT